MLHHPHFRLDTWSNLTLAQYLDPIQYNNLMDTVAEATEILRKINQGTRKWKRDTNFEVIDRCS